MDLKIQGFYGSVGMLLECLRYAGVVSHVDRLDNEGYSFTLHPPKGVDKKIWAEHNAARMATFGIIVRK